MKVKKMTMNKCVKCGGEAEHIKLYDSKRYDCFFRCKGCGRETAVYTNKQNAIDAWNDGKLELLDEDMIELLRKRALEGRMSVQDKQVMLVAADRIEKLKDNNAGYTLRKVQERVAMHFGTYTDKDTVRVLDVIKLLSQIAEEIE